MNVTGWSGSASLLTFQRPTRRESLHVGNIHYRQLPGYRLEVKTAGSGVSSEPSCAALPLVVGEFLIFLGWNGTETGHLEVQRMPAGKEFGRIGELLRGWRALLASRKRRRDTDVGPANPVSLPGAFKNRGDVGGGVLHVNRPKA